MSETSNQSKLPQDPRDPLGVLIVPVFGVLLVAVILLWFNQKKEETEENFFPVKGKVTLNGEPLDGWYHIDFYPVEGSSNPVASSWIDRDGSYDLYSGHGGHYGAMPGKYRVVVKMLEGEQVSWRIDAARAGNIEIDPKDGGTLTPPDPDPPFDIRFSKWETTPQRAIVGNSENSIDIDLPPFKAPKDRAASPSNSKKDRKLEKEQQAANGEENPPQGKQASESTDKAPGVEQEKSGGE